MATTIDSLAVETLSQIFDNLVPSSRATSDLVCQRWRDPAQRVLFNDAYLTGGNNARSWIEARARYRPSKVSWNEGFSLLESRLFRIPDRGAYKDFKVVHLDEVVDVVGPGMECLRVHAAEYARTDWEVLPPRPLLLLVSVTLARSSSGF